MLLIERGASMNLSEVFIKRPIATSLIMLGIAVFGIVAYRALPVSDLPNVDFPTLNVGAGLPGGDPSARASAVASAASVSHETGTSDGAGGRREGARAAVMPLLPAGLPAPPSFRKFNPADSP